MNGTDQAATGVADPGTREGARAESAGEVEAAAKRGRARPALCPAAVDRPPSLSTGLPVGGRRTPQETWLPVEQLVVHPDNPRRHHENGSLDELVKSIAAQGVLEPLLVRTDASGQVQVLAGSRRLAAAKRAGLSDVPVRMLLCDDQQAIEVMLTENLQRQDVTPLEEAEGIALLRDRCGLDYRTIATRLGKSVGHVHGRAKLATLQPDVKKAWAKGWLQLGHVLVFAPLQPPEQDALLKWMREVAYHSPEDGNLVTADELREHVHHDVLLDLKSAPWKLDDATLLSAAGPCDGCVFRTSSQAELFPGLTHDRCSKPGCFATKFKLWGAGQIAAEERRSGKKLIAVTESHRKVTPAVLTSASWMKVSKAGRCQSTKRAARLDDAGRPVQFLDVCADKDCKVHWAKNTRKGKGAGSSGGSQESYQRERQKREEDEKRDLAEAAAMTEVLRKGLHAQALPKLAGELVAVPQQLVVEVIRVLEHTFGGSWKDAVAAAGLAQAKGGKLTSEKVHVLAPVDLVRLLFELVIADEDNTPGFYGNGSWRAVYHRFASAFGLDVKGPAKVAVQAHDLAHAKPAKAEKPATAKGKKRGRGKGAK